MTIILSNLNRFTIFFTGRFLSKFAVKRILNIPYIPPHLAYFATLPRETLMSAKQAIKDKLQGTSQWRNDGVAAASSDGGHWWSGGGSPRQFYFILNQRGGALT